MLAEAADHLDSRLIISSKTVESLRDDVENRDAEIARLRDYYKAQNEALSRENDELQDGKWEVESKMERVSAEHIAQNVQNEDLMREMLELQAKFDAVNADYEELERARFMKDEKDNDAKENEERETDNMYFELASTKDDVQRVQGEKEVLEVYSIRDLII
jgi:predicted nuclease with TOPRIM domain